METRCYKCLRPLKWSVRYGLHETCFVEWFRLPAVMDFEGLSRESAPDSGDALSSERWSSSFFQGKFKKYSAILNRRSYILKFKGEAYPELTTVEYLCNRIARALKLPVPDFYLLRIGDEPVFVSRNFMGGKHSNLEHVYQYVAAGDYNCERLCELIRDETQTFRDLKAFIRACLFDALVGNHDRHGRNLAFIVSPGGKSLAPIYDNPSALGLESGAVLRSRFSPKGKILTARSEEPTAKDYVAEFRRLGHEDEVRAFVRSVKLDNVEALIEGSFCSASMKNALRRLVAERYEEMKAELKDAI